jgi:hypothetical protein
MSMQKLPAKTGWLWIKEGIAIFRKQPFEIVSLFFACVLLTMPLHLIPVVGQFAAIVLVPTLSMIFMQACADVEQGKRLRPNVILVGFRSPRFPSLLILGVFYLASAALAVWVSTLIDGGVFLKVVQGTLAPDSPQVLNSNMQQAMLAAAVVYTPAAMAFWYAAPLVVWKDMGAGKAAFYSFFAVWKLAAPFLVYALAGGILAVVVLTLFSAIVGAIVGILLGMGAAKIVLAMFLSVFTAVVFCTFYPTYTSVFGKPYSSDEPDVSESDGPPVA